LAWRCFLSSTAKRAHAPPPRTVPGQLQIAAASLANPEYSATRGWWTGVLTGPGIEPMAVIHEDSARTEKWPEEGQTVPVIISLSSPIKIEIVWDKVPTRRQKGLQRAQSLLDRVKSG
jgi:hypothetical protein